MTDQELAAFQLLHRAFADLQANARSNSSTMPALRTIRSMAHELCVAGGEDPLPFVGQLQRVVTGDMSHGQWKELRHRLAHDDAVNQFAGDGEHRHEVPTADGVMVEVVDSNGYLTLVARIEAEEKYLFVEHDLATKRHERCFLVQLESPPDEHWADIANWESHLPKHCSYATDLDTPDGLVMVGCRADQHPDARLGKVLWDSHGGEGEE